MPSKNKQTSPRGRSGERHERRGAGNRGGPLRSARNKRREFQLCSQLPRWRVLPLTPSHSRTLSYLSSLFVAALGLFLTPFPCLPVSYSLLALPPDTPPRQRAFPPFRRPPLTHPVSRLHGPIPSLHLGHDRRPVQGFSPGEPPLHLVVRQQVQISAESGARRVRHATSTRKRADGREGQQPRGETGGVKRRRNRNRQDLTGQDGAGRARQDGERASAANWGSPVLRAYPRTVFRMSDL